MPSIRTIIFIFLICAACLAACNRPTSIDPIPADPRLSAATLTALPSIPPSQRTTTALQRTPPTSPPPSPTFTPTSLPTPDLVATAQSGSPAVTRSSQVSPDGLWWARVFSHPCPATVTEQAYGYDYLQFTDQRTAEHQVLFTQLISCGGLGTYGLEGLFWSPTSRFYYFTDAASGTPDGCGYWRQPLLRVDLSDWSITPLGAGVISPDGFKLAAWLDGNLIVWDLNGGMIGSAPPPVAGALPGPIAWSPNGQSIAYLLSQDRCPLGLTYLVRLNLSDFQPALYHASQDPSFAGLSWTTPNRVNLIDENGRTWSYNFISGTLSHGNNP